MHIGGIVAGVTWFNYSSVSGFCCHGLSSPLWIRWQIQPSREGCLLRRPPTATKRGTSHQMHRPKSKNTRIMKKQGNMAFSKHSQLLNKWIQRYRNDWNSRQASGLWVLTRADGYHHWSSPATRKWFISALALTGCERTWHQAYVFLPHRQTQRGTPEVTWMWETLAPQWRQPLPYLCSRALEPEHHGGAGTAEQVKVKQKGLVPVKKENTVSISGNAL